MPSSSHTVFSSRGTPSIVTCNRVLLRPPQGRKQAREPRSSEFPLHVAREGVVVRDLLLDLQEFVVEAAALVLQALQRIEEMLLSEAPPLRLLPGYLEGTGHCQRPLGIGDTWDREGRVCASPLRSVRSRSYSRIFLRTPSNSFRNVIRRRSTCRRRSRIRFRRSRHFLCSSKASSTLEGSMGRLTPDCPDYLIVMSALYSAFTCAVGRTVLNRSKRFIAWLTTSRAIPSVASVPMTSSRLSIFHTLTKFATVRCVAASLTRTLPMRFSPSRVVDRERT